MNPYYGQNFVGFFLQFFYRLWGLLTGQLPLAQLASDEIQVFVLAGVAISAALVGCFLVLRRMTMLANSLSHTILMGIVLAFLFSKGSPDEHGHAVFPLQAMLWASLLMGFITVFLTELLHKVGRLQEDASMGIVFTSLFALGVILVTILTRNAHIGIEAVMGNADALHVDDLELVLYILGTNILLFLFFFKEYKLTTFDASLARALGFSTTFFNYLLMTQVSATSIGAFRAVGVLLVLAFMTGPALAARLLTEHLSKMLLWASSLGALAALIGVAITRHILTTYGVALSTSGVVVCTIVLLYVIVLVAAPQKGLVAKLLIHRKFLKPK